LEKREAEEMLEATEVDFQSQNEESFEAAGALNRETFLTMVLREELLRFQTDYLDETMITMYNLALEYKSQRNRQFEDANSTRHIQHALISF
jgi:hypothetical protein